MRFTESPILDDDGKRIIIPGISNFGRNSFDKINACHNGYITGKYIGRIKHLTITHEILKGKSKKLPTNSWVEGFPVQVYEN
ncbi:MAG TPA: hypothetical protein PLG90_13335 [Ignavibacteria bacterium]|nr:hypothetical protein [Ignavibacteria bacterium]